jgi:predicted unusual protein kinase regulating ubiquinone biosynthesis (AarF/ABC1/UbiB family)
MSDEDGDDAEQLAKDLEELGPTFVKLGQLLSGRSDLLPPLGASWCARTSIRIVVEGFFHADPHVCRRSDDQLVAFAEIC